MKLISACLLTLIAITSAAQAGEIHCVQTKGSASTIQYSVDGQITPNLARVKIVSQANDGSKKTDIDTRSNFVFVETIGQNNIYISAFESDRTGAYQFDLKFALNTVQNDDGTYKATYSKQIKTEADPVQVTVKLTCSVQ